MTALVLIILLLYFLPSMVAICRSVNVVSVIIINFLFGWTLIGWVVALALSLGSSATPGVSIVNNVNATVGDKNTVAKEEQFDYKELAKEGASVFAEACKNWCMRNKKTLMIVFGVVAGVWFVVSLWSLYTNHVAKKEFYETIELFESNSPAMAEFSDCKNLYDEEYGYVFCRCLYEYSLKVSDKWFEEKEAILKKNYEFSHQKKRDLQDLIERYYNAGVEICTDAIG